MESKADGYHVEPKEIIEGFFYAYRQLDASTTRVYEASAQVYALVELLVAKGIIGVEELEERKKIVEKRLEDSYKKAGIGVKIQHNDVDKYKISEEVKIDCGARMHLCQAACCQMTYSLSIQDIYEGICWNLGNPFTNSRRADGYCVHLEKDGHKCTVYAGRPLVCRTYDCRKDARIWSDFENMVLSPQLSEAKITDKA